MGDWKICLVGDWQNKAKRVKQVVLSCVDLFDPFSLNGFMSRVE
jgi:hypothetical protein